MGSRPNERLQPTFGGRGGRFVATVKPCGRALEADIDRLVYALYGLTPEEIALVEGKP